ncbi:trypsin-1-like isoform X4 [Periplaneta americana]|uniref:trypsin-1-like isoform X4 n=1 Tax=Periplaneta americana TaxID=6978 RepID=UPI0037E752B2
MMRSLILLAVLAAAVTQGKTVPRIPITRGSRIVNGYDAVRSQFPGMLSLQVSSLHTCGASILNENWALTAAHCVKWYNASSITLYAGSIYLSSGGTTHNVSEIVIHESYDGGDSLVNDIAVLKVSNPFQIDGVDVKPISLPPPDQNPPDGMLAEVIGWGELGEHGDSSDTLQKVNLAIINQAECRRIYVAEQEHVYDSQICAGLPVGIGGSCRGDDGGPLIVEGNVVGLVSWSYHCALPEYPTVYTRVPVYVDWIKQNTGV